MNAEEIEEKIKAEILQETSEENPTGSAETLEKNSTPENTKDEFEDDFSQFERHKTVHQVEQLKEDEKNKDIFSDDNEISTADEFKLQFFLGLIFSLLDGVHLILYRMFTKYKLEKEDIALDDADKSGLEMYFKTKRVMALINKLPGEIIGLVHIEYIYMQKFNAFTAQAKLAEGSEPDNEEDDDDPEEQEEKKPPVKRRPAKKRKKKKAVKKAVVKKDE